MAATETLDIKRNGRREGTTTATIRPGDFDAAHRAKVRWLERNGWDESLWDEFTIMAPTPTGWREVA